LQEYDLQPVLDRENVAVLAAYDAQSGVVPSTGQPTSGLGRVEAQGEQMLAKLDRDLDGQLRPVEAELAHLDKDIETQARVVEVRKATTTEKLDQKRATQLRVEAIAAANAQPFIWVRKLPWRAYAILLGVFGLADVVLNATALLIIGEGNLVVWGLAMALVAALLWMSHVAGTEMREAEEHPDDPRQRRQRRWALLGVVAVILVFLVAIGSIRAQFLQTQGVGGHLLAVYALQLIVAAAAVAAAYYHANSYAHALEQATSQVQRAQEAQEAQEEELTRLAGDRAAKVRDKVYLALDHVRVGEVVVSYTDELKHVYAAVYRQTRQATGQPPVELLVSRTQIPGWMREWAAWINRQTVVERPSVGTTWQLAPGLLALPPPPAT